MIRQIPEMKLLEICGENTHEDMISFVPCLLNNGHRGNHKHIEICNSLSCMCMGIEKRMNSNDYDRYIEIDEKIKKLNKERDGIILRYKK